jgi:predicted DNA-binding protein with PD1-like motif
LVSAVKSKLIHESDGQRTYVVVMSAGDEAISCLEQFAREVGLSAASLTAIGAFRSAELAYFDWEAKRYLPIPVDEQVEVASLIGDVAIGPDGKAAIHAHVVLGKRMGTAVAGHLKKADVRPTLEIVVTESPVHLRKRHDPASGLALIDPGA